MLSMYLSTALLLALGPTPGAPDELADALARHLAARSSDGHAARTRAVLEETFDREGVLADPAALRAAVAEALAPGRSELRPGNVRGLSHGGGAFRADGLEYAVRLPRRYGKDEGPWPLLLSLPGEGEGAEHHLRERWPDAQITERFILVAPTLDGDPETWKQVAVDGRPAGLSRALTALRLAQESLHVDPDRVVVAGEGPSVPAVLEAVRQDPGRFAGALCVRGVDLGGEIHPFLNVPLLLVGGDPSARAFREACLARSVDGCAVEAALSDDGIASWLLARRRDPLPARVLLTIGPTIPNACHWLEVAPMTPDAEVRAEADPDARRISLWCAGVSYVTLLLSDDLVPLDGPLTVVVNGDERSVEVERSLARTLDRIVDRSSDGGRVYTAELVVDTRGAEGERAEPDDTARAAAEAWIVGHLDDPERAAARGWFERDGSWYHPDDRARLRRGERRDPETWLWTTRAERKAAEEGALRIDAEWLPADSADEAAAGLWPVEGEWVPLAEADARHSRTTTPWRIPAPHVVLESTASRATSYRALAEMTHCVPILERALGVVPALPLDVVLMREEEQYDRYASGPPDGHRAPAHGDAWHLIHSAFFAELRLERDGSGFAYDGAGVGLWNADYENGDAFGRHAARLAFALSWLDAVDPSPRATRALRDGEPDPEFAAEFEGEKALPRWLRWGVAVYAERYFFDDRIEGNGSGVSPWWARGWSLANLAHEGGRASLADAFAFEVVPSDRSGSRRLMLTAGALVSFALDGECEPVEAAWAALRARLLRGAPRSDEVEALEAALREHAADLDAFLEAASAR